jgi:ATP-binding cassette, subfamily B, bacterial
VNVKRLTAGLAQTVRQDGRTLRRALQMIYAAAPRYVTATASVMLAEAALPLASVWLLKRVIDTVAAATRGPGVPTNTSGLALALAGSYLLLIGLQQAVRGISRFLHCHVNDLLVGQMMMRAMEKASAHRDLSPFESPRFHDRLQLLQRDLIYRPTSLFTGLFQAGQAGLVLLGMLCFLARLHPGFLLLFAFTAGPGVFCQRRLQEAAWGDQVDLIPLRRRLASYAQVLLTAPFAKEVRLFDLADHFLARYREQFRELMAHLRHVRWRLAGASIALSLLTALGVGGAFAYVITQALRGALTLGDLSLYTGALLQASAAAAGLAAALAGIHEALPMMRELFAFLDSAPAILAPTSGRRLFLNGEPEIPSRGRHTRQRHGFRLERVRFRYPDAERLVFDDLGLEIPWGKTTALVGENGAGKSTLVKLLTRLYDPAAGVILLDGIDLREYNLEDLRRHVGVVFQDFARYQLPVWENIGVGDVSRLGDRALIRESARRGGADDVICRLPQGEETLLGREFDGGVELSGGEWQKIALARAFMRRAPILILDEPTAALDARSEYDVYRRFLELAMGRTTLLISHRFSTVQIADRILVLEGGVVVEEGDHRGLVARGGRYAEMYAMQAERYR